METTKFLQSVLGEHGHYCIFGALPSGRKKQQFHASIPDAVRAAERLCADGYNVYFGLATFGDKTKKTDYGEKRVRTADNTLEMRSFYLDLDCGPAKDYDTQTEALMALRQFCDATSLPRPLVVNSGRGIHAYWRLRDPVPVAQWLPVAEALKRACAVEGLNTDTTVTADAARVLRVPGTKNFKDDPASDVFVYATSNSTALTFAAFKGFMTPYAAPEDDAAVAVLNTVKLSVHDDPVMKRLLGGQENSFKLIVQKTAAGKGCAQLGFCLSNPAEVSEPLWRSALSIAKFCTDVDKAAVRLSEGHPEYNPAQMRAKLEGIAGPHHCSQFAGHRPGVCEACPLWGKITSPIVLGRNVKEASPEDNTVELPVDPDTPDAEPETIDIPTLPWPYFRGATGGVWTKEKDEEGDLMPVRVYINDLFYTQRIVDPEKGECVVGRLLLPNDGLREFIVPLVAATAKEELRKILAENGVAAIGKQWDKLMQYTHAWIEQLQTTTIADTARSQFGWTDDTMTSFVLGDREIFADKVGYNPPSSSTAYLFPAMRPKGTLEGWVKQADFYNRPGLEPYQYMICHAMAAPLMRFTPIHAAIFDIYSDGSGHGKSTTQFFASTIYGEPSALVVGPNDTLNSRMNRMEVLKDINIQFDEFTEFPAEDTSKLIYEATGGRQKARMSSGSNAERHRGDAWHLTMTSSSNHSMLAKVFSVKSNPRAEVQRVLRYHVQPHNFTDKSETDAFAKSVGENQALAAEVFIQYVLRNKTTVQELLSKVQRQLDSACGLTMQNRFWSVQGAATITALICAREAGLLSYNVKSLFAWVVSLIEANKGHDTETTLSVDNLLNDYVNENYGNILWIKSTADMRGVAGSNNNGLDSLVVPEQQPRNRLVARYETDLKRLFLVPKPLQQWCAKQRINYDSMVKQAMEKFGGEKGRMRLSKGTKLNLPPTAVIILNCDSLDLAEPDHEGAGD